MPKVPIYEGRQVREQIAPNARLTVSASPETFGAGAGRGLQDVSNAIGEAKIQADRAAVKEQTLGLAGDSLNLESEFKTISGRDTAASYEKFTSNFESAIANREKALANDRQKEAFRRDAELRRQSFQRVLNSHMGREIEVYKAKVHNAYVETAVESAIQNYNDPSRVGVELLRIEAENRDFGAENGLSSEVVDQNIRKAKSAVHTGIIERMLANGQDISARDYMAEHRDEISGEHLARVEKSVEAGTLRFESQRRSDDIVARYADRDAALAEARAIEDADLRDATISRVKSRFAERKQAEDERRQEIFKQSGDLVEQSGTTDAIPPADWAELNLTERQALERRASQIRSGKAPVTDWTTYTELREKAVQHPNKFANESLIRYRDKLADAEYKELVKLQKSVKEGDATLKDAATLQQQLSTAHNIMDWDAGDRDKKGQFNQAVYTALNAAEQAAGKKLSFDERQKIIDRMLIQGEVKRGSFFLPDPDRQFFQVAGTSDEAAFVPDVPDDEREKIEDALRRANRPVTDEMVMMLYQQKVGLK